MITKRIFIPAIEREITFYIGQNAQDNFDMIDMCKGIDMWFHVHNESSCHVIAVIPGDNTYNKKQFAKIIIQGALCCKQNSNVKNKQGVEICYSRLINIVKTHVVGQVYMREYKTTIV